MISTMKQAVEEVALKYTGSVIRSFGTCGIPSGISDIKEMITDAFKKGAEWQIGQSPWVKVSDGPPLSDGYYLVTDGVNLAVAYFFKEWGKFAKYREYPHPLYDDGVVKLYMSIPPISFDWIIGLDKYVPE